MDDDSFEKMMKNKEALAQQGKAKAKAKQSI